MNKHCTILLNTGRYPSNVTRLVQNTDWIVATDGAWLHSKKIGIEVDLVIGDLDSIDNSVPENKKLYIYNQDKSDCEKALDYAQEQGYTHIQLIGISGDRLDHTLYHLQLMHRYNRFFDSLVGYSETERCWLVRSTEKITGKSGQRIALINLNDSHPITLQTQGLKWPVEQLQNHSASNEFVADEVTIKVQTNDNNLLVMVALN